ncbi:grasp-with-spasm system ATP-grasp peptide maturase [Chryseobacterium indoltheticum]|uniref:grasp-with-spasm system ATP-grasp peptide maturase n=1 Tax=Chryseobacterium indoltheticum TaxID=254 RepID=UPI001911BFF0|nr:grasp-with-spasm system ATP-grasp peptide maturase [Chryseobacterium indoltheticum]QQQ26865.1 grasp-with-spasm system ATP-grasp peptide maturase [Chryseobacterium indoltheticum]
MILILSQNQETTTNEVIKWLSLMNKKFVRVHEDEIFEVKINKNRIFIESQRNLFFLDDITSVWYRRGGLRFSRMQYSNPSVNNYMNETQYWLEDYVLKTLESKRYINKQSNNHLNKLLNLEEAKKIGLDVPKYFLAENTKEVILNKTVTKSIAENIILDSFYEDSDGIIYTSVITQEEDDDFFITFFQEKVEKDFEIRSFYLNGKTWSTAIFSQNDEQTKIDFRKYDHDKPSRNVRYNLPKHIEEKTHNLMQILDLNCGSIDFIKSGDKYFFLEVNPVGQFLGLSAVCNYSLEKEISKFL